MIDRITLPLKTVSEANRREHWAKKAKRTSFHRDMAKTIVKWQFGYGPLPSPPLTVTLCRVAPRPLDDDNLRGSLKAIRDGVADALLPCNRGNQSSRWADDGGGQISWIYTQERGKPKQYQVVVTIDGGDTHD